jgi:signal transduction histidine kinase
MKDQLLSAEENFRKEIIRRSSPWLGSLILLILVIRTVSGHLRYVPGIIAYIIVCGFFIIPYLIKKNVSSRLCAVLLLSCLTGLGLLGGLFNAGIQSPASIIFATLPLVGFLIAGEFGARIAILYTLVSISIFILGEHIGFIQIYQRPTAFSNFLTLSIFIATLLTYLIGRIYEQTRRKLELRILELVGVMHENTRLASLGEMASGVAHEINNPLAIIVGTAEKVKRMLHDPVKSKEQIDAEMDKLITIAFRAGKISSGLLTFSRDAKNDPFQACQTGHLLQETLNLCQERFKAHHVELKINHFPDIEMECREGQIIQVLLNLLNNAFDAVRTLPDKWVQLDLNITPDGQVQISVMDSGQGIPVEIADRLMDPFFTTKAIGQGTGLGLSISRGIIASHHGTLTLDRKSSNTRFVVQLPMFQTR